MDSTQERNSLVLSCIGMYNTELIESREAKEDNKETDFVVEVER